MDRFYHLTTEYLEYLAPSVLNSFKFLCFYFDSIFKNLVDFLLFKKLILIIQIEDLMLRIVKVHFQTAPYLLEKLQDTVCKHN
jgi:hypothetical protein